MEIDFKFGQYREAFSLFGKSFGKWSDLPEIEYVSIFPTQLNQKINSIQSAHSTSNSLKEVRINLVYNRNRRLHVFTSKNQEEIMQLAMQFGDELEIGVYDCTGEENVWLKPK